MKRIYYFFVVLMFVFSACGKTNTDEAGLIFNIDDYSQADDNRGNGLYYAGEKVADIQTVFLQISTTLDQTLTKKTKQYDLTFSIDGSLDWDVEYDPSIKNMNLAARIGLLETPDRKTQVIKVFSREIDGIRYEGVSAMTSGEFSFSKASSTNIQSLNVKQFKFYHNPKEIKEAVLKAHIDIKTDSGEHIEIIYRGALRVL